MGMLGKRKNRTAIYSSVEAIFIMANEAEHGASGGPQRQSEIAAGAGRMREF